MQSFNLNLNLPAFQLAGLISYSSKRGLRLADAWSSLSFDLSDTEVIEQLTDGRLLTKYQAVNELFPPKPISN